MRATIFTTPIINPVMHWLARAILFLWGWRIEGVRPQENKYVLIAAPHTSNWDFPLTLLMCFALRLQVYWMGKHSLFPPVLGGIMRWLGGIPVNRGRAGQLVQTTVAAFQTRAHLIVIIPPEGTRDKVTHWKTGFYHIAHGAGVPIALGYLDFKRKVGGIGLMLRTSGDIERDMHDIRAFYQPIQGKNARQFDSETIQTRDRDRS
jgi:1-acyl-sn-glycerol-3-phosphate acyltransferase